MRMGQGNCISPWRSVEASSDEVPVQSDGFSCILAENVRGGLMTPRPATRRNRVSRHLLSRSGSCMTTVRLTCPCGNVWEHTGVSPYPADLREICPVCTRNNPTDKTRSPASSPWEPLATTDFTLNESSGKIIAGFEVLSEINRGGMGVIYKARQMGMNRLVALKVIAPSRLNNPEAKRRFQREVEVSALLNHPNIVTVFATDLDGPIPFMAMEYVPGIDLHRLVKLSGPLAPADACHYAQQVAHGLQHAFELGMVHRDIKPANLMVTPNPLEKGSGKTSRLPRVKILDMGLARVIDDSEGTELTRDGIFLGTPDYVAPEQAEDSKQADIRSDIYSLGASLYYVLTGCIPFTGASVVQKLRKQLMEPPPSVLAKRPELGIAIDSLIRRMMARNPAERMQTPAELIDLLDRVIRGGSIPVLMSIPVGTTTGTTNLQAEPTPLSNPTLPAAVASPSSSHLTPPGAATAKGHTGGLNAIAAEGQLLLTGGLEGTIKSWNPIKFKELRTFTGDAGAVEQLAIAPGGKWAASCSVRLTAQDMGVQLWDPTTGKERRRLKGPADNIRCVAISPDAMRVAAGAADHTVWVWSVQGGGAKVLCLKGHTAPVTGVVFARTADSLLTAGQDATIRQWDVATGKEKGVLSSNVGSVTALAFSGKRVAVAGSQGLAVRQRDGSFVKCDGHDGDVRSLSFNADGTRLATASMDGTIRLWDTEDGNELHCFRGHLNAAWAVAFGPDGGVVYSGGQSGTFHRWPVPS